jgi:hypothetical protein
MAQRYYVSVETGQIQEARLDDHIHYYEIQATNDEVRKVEELLRRLKDTEYDPMPIVTSLNEENGEEIRSEQGHLMAEIYENIYRFGTSSTKEEIRSLGILKQL